MYKFLYFPFALLSTAFTAPLGTLVNVVAVALIGVARISFAFPLDVSMSFGLLTFIIGWAVAILPAAPV